MSHLFQLRGVEMHKSLLEYDINHFYKYYVVFFSNVTSVNTYIKNV